MASELEQHVQLLLDDLLLEAAADVSLSYVSAANARVQGLKMQEELQELQHLEDARDQLRERHVARCVCPPPHTHTLPIVVQVPAPRGARVCAARARWR